MTTATETRHESQTAILKLLERTRQAIEQMPPDVPVNYVSIRNEHDTAIAVDATKYNPAARRMLAGCEMRLDTNFAYTPTSVPGVQYQVWKGDLHDLIPKQEPESRPILPPLSSVTIPDTDEARLERSCKEIREVRELNANAEA